MTVAELELRMDAVEYADWAAYETVTGPLGWARLDALFAHQTMHLVSVHVDPKKTGRLRASDFAVKWDRKPTSEDALLAWARRHNERISSGAA